MALLGSTPTLDEAPRPIAAKPATMGEVFGAARVLARGDRTDAEAERLRRGYEPILAEINADRARRGEAPLANPGLWVDGDLARRPSLDRSGFDLGHMFEDRVNRAQQQARIFAELRAIRRRDPGFLAGVPDDDASFGQQLVTRERGARDVARGTLARSSGIGGMAAGFAGGVVETTRDPVNLFSLPLGGGGKTIVSQIARSALVNGGLELIQQPVVALNREDLGEELTLGEAAANVGFAATAGALFEVGVPQAAKAVGRAADATYNRLRPGGRIASALAKADLPDEALAATFSDLVPDAIRSFDERAALHVIGREAEVRAASPFVPTPQGMDAHAARLQASIETILAAQPAASPRLRGTLPDVSRGTARPVVRAGGVAGDIVRFFREKGYSEAQARGIAAGIQAEAASNHNAVNAGSGAFGLGQWLGSRKAELIRRYGPRPTREQQLEFLHWELQGGDAGGRAVLAGDDEAGVLDAYVRAFMRPAAGAETNGDIARGMAALGRDGDVPPARGLEAEDPTLARPAELNAMRSPIDGPELVEIDMPELRGELFPDEASWRGAQAAADADALGLGDAALGDAAVRALDDGLAEQAARTGDFGPVFDDIDARDWRAVVDRLRTRGEGEVEGALRHPEIGAIDVVWGDERYGLAKIMARHPEVVEDLPAIVERLPVAQRPEQVGNNRFVLEDETHRAVISPDFHGKPKQWIVTAFEKKSPPDLTSRRGPDGAPDGGSTGAGDGLNVARNSAVDNAGGAARDALDTASPPAGAPRQLDLFDDPAGEGASLQADSLVHDLRARLDAPDAGDAGRTYRLEDGSERTAADILADLDEDEAIIAQIRGCL